MNRRNFLRGLAVAAAAPLILPEAPKIWQLDRTMLVPRAPDPAHWGSVMDMATSRADILPNIPQRFDSGMASFEKLYPGWVVVKKADTFGPYEEWSAYKPGTPEASFTLRVDRAMRHTPSYEYTRRVAEDMALGIRSQEYLLESVGTAGPPEEILPGHAASPWGWNEPIPEVNETQPADWPEWWR